MSTAQKVKENVESTNVVSLTHLNLVRARKALIQAHRKRDWHAVKTCDIALTSQLDQAFDDPNRNQESLLVELEAILALYADMVTTLPEGAVLKGC